MEFGDGISRTKPAYEGYALPHAAMRGDLIARDLMEYMTKTLTGRCYPLLDSNAEMKEANQICGKWNPREPFVVEYWRRRQDLPATSR